MKGRPIAFLVTAVGAVSVLLCGIFRKEIAASADPAAEEARKIAEYTEKFANPFVAAAEPSTLR